MLSIEIVGLDATVEKMGALPQTLISKLRPVMRRLGADFVGYIKQSKLSGQVLKNRTGTLRRSVNFNTTETTNSITINAGPRGVPYAAYHEFGFSGAETVKAHQRHITQAFGHPADAIQDVRSYTRNVKYPAHSYMRTALADYREIIRERIETALNGAK